LQITIGFAGSVLHWAERVVRSGRRRRVVAAFMIWDKNGRRWKEVEGILIAIGIKPRPAMLV
jgi:hypothetical protein